MSLDGSLVSTDHIAGWHCGPGYGATNPSENVDWTADVNSYPTTGTRGMGQGTENYFFEHLYFDSDLANRTFDVCGRTNATDSDGDGWTAGCGDTNDNNASVHP